MQIAGLSQCFSRQETVKMGMKRDGSLITYLITSDYEPHT